MLINPVGDLVNLSLQPSSGMDAIPFARSFAVGIALDGVDPIICSWTTPLIDESDMTDPAKLLIVERK